MGKGYKVVVCGMASVGKTAILEQLLYGKHTVGLEEGATMEDVYLASVETDRGVKEQLRLYDTRGLQEGVELPKHYFSVADGFVLVYAVTSLEAFQRVELLKKEIDVFRDKKEALCFMKALIWYYTPCCNAERELQPQQDLCSDHLCNLSKFSLIACRLQLLSWETKLTSWTKGKWKQKQHSNGQGLRK
ncbi:PREDICTED: NF-kappa-B inhibitor-interacting Ras-like protein 1 isoform X3 [Pseudopodoces humilis]|uniref:NF-kappa-B inhibitor-interacting Ras-like protein 1 isoform X3 n=1 Tax=Pseudopodoces humilis TaxID=181119 RepID=UPI0006B75B12|nr:PREDICTED: NF-kappa-B inhibitor-interacting Ras-like protein 1 isoform X3 [Pseudopodoces humilis]